MSKRQIVRFCREVLGIPVAVGAVCKLEQTVRQVLRPLVEQARTYVQHQPAQIDETPWRERTRRCWLWTVVTPRVSVFRIAPSRGAPVLHDWDYAGVKKRSKMLVL
jgi:hypothetical protein